MSGLRTVLAAVGEGRIQGGWEYVKAAYAICWTGLSLYALSLFIRRRRSEEGK
jgi:hypothetical protein